jgi:hypothetical protein
VLFVLPQRSSSPVNSSVIDYEAVSQDTSGAGWGCHAAAWDQGRGRQQHEQQSEERSAGGVQRAKSSHGGEVRSG